MATRIDAWVMNWMRALDLHHGDWMIVGEEAERIGSARKFIYEHCNDNVG